jgi:hypothetical protein
MIGFLLGGVEKVPRTVSTLHDLPSHLNAEMGRVISLINSYCLVLGPIVQIMAIPQDPKLCHPTNETFA